MEKKKISRKKIILVVIGCITIAIVAGLILSWNEITYRSAVKSLDNGEYQLAIRKFNKIQEYKDVDKLLPQAYIGKLDVQVDEAISEGFPNMLESHDYSGYLKKVESIRVNEYYDDIEASKIKQLDDTYHYAQFLDYMFVYDKDKSLDDIDYSENQYWGDNLKSFYKNVFLKYKNKSGSTKDSYKYFDDEANYILTMEVRPMMSYKDEGKPFDDNNFNSELRVLVGCEGPDGYSISASAITPADQLKSIKLKPSNKTSINSIYDSETYKNEMGGLDVLFNASIEGSNATVKYVPHYYDDSKGIRTVKIKLK